MRAIKSLPENYHHLDTLDLSKSRSVLWMNLAALPLIFFFAWLFNKLINLNHTINSWQTGFFGFLSGNSLIKLIIAIIVIILMIILHELIHGFFFWLFTHEQPNFGLKSGYASAAAPSWYFPSQKYILIGLSPFIIISTVSVVLGWFVNSLFIPYLVLIASFNAAGSLGDLIVILWILKQPKNILVNDHGDRYFSFAPEPAEILP